MNPANRPRMFDRAASPPPTGDIESIAADWLALGACRPLTPPEHAALAAWLAAEPRHRTVYSELEAAWLSLDRLTEYPRPGGAPANPDFFGRRRPQLHRSWLAVGAAAALLVTAGVWLSPWSLSSSRSDVSAGRFAAANESTLRRLSDGSLVELRSGSAITEEFVAAERGVRLLRGEAFFSVKKDSTRPFVVRAGAVSVRAVGTAFSVRLATSAVEVLVTEGIVRLNPPPDAPAASTEAFATATHLTARQRVSVPTGSQPFATAPIVETVSVLELDRALAWQDTTLVFESTPLAEAALQFNLRNVRQLTVAQAKVGALLISGRFRADNLDGFIELLETSLGVTVTRQGDDLVLGGQR